jgi:antitoxin VapB
MQTAKLFRNGRSQAVRLPREFAMPGEEVYVRKISGIVMLIPITEDPWKHFAESLAKFSDDFADFSREQGAQESRQPIE